MIPIKHKIKTNKEIDGLGLAKTGKSSETATLAVA